MFLLTAYCTLYLLTTGNQEQNGKGGRAAVISVLESGKDSKQAELWLHAFHLWKMSLFFSVSRSVSLRFGKVNANVPEKLRSVGRCGTFTTE